MPNWFTKNLMLGAIFSQLCKGYEHYKRHIYSVDEFKNYSFFLEQTSEDLIKYHQLITRCLLSAKNFDMEKIEKQLTGFLRVSMFKESVEGAAKKYKSQGFDEAYDWTLKRLNDIKDATFEDDEYRLSFQAPKDWIKMQEQRTDDAISTGCANLDQALGGGLFKNETCAIMAPSNVGKTTAMITIARNAILQGKHVLFIIHEGDPQEIRFRILCAFMGIERQTAFNWIKDPEKSQYVMMASEIIDHFLVYIPFIKTGAMFVEDLIGVIKKLSEERVAKNGKGFDIIIDDYPKKLKSRFRSSSKEGLYRNEVSEVYDNFNHLAVELNAHCLLAVQTNRTGLKMNNNKVESDSLLGMEEIDEAFGIAQNVANVLTLNRSPEDRKNNIIRMNVAKSRNNPTDVAVNSRTKYSCFLTFGDKNMFNFTERISPGWQPDIEGGFLAAYSQDTNRKEGSDVVHHSLLEKEGKVPGKIIPSPESNVGVFIPNGRAEA